MDNEQYRELACKAWKLYYLTIEVQKLLNRIFFDEFMELDAAEEEKRYRKQFYLPF